MLPPPKHKPRPQAQAFFEVRETTMGGKGWWWALWLRNGSSRAILAAHTGVNSPTKEEAILAIEAFKHIVANSTIEEETK